MKGRTPLIADILTLLADGRTGETTVKFAVIINNRTAENFELNRFDTEREAVAYLWLVSQYLRKEASDNADVVKIDGEGRLEELGSVTRRADTLPKETAPMAPFEYRVGPSHWYDACSLQQEALAQLFRPGDIDWAAILADRISRVGDCEGVGGFVLEFLEAYLPGSGKAVANVLRARLGTPCLVSFED